MHFSFPGEPYPVQVEFMKSAYVGMTEGGISVLESPTGTGKSLSLLCSALSWLRDHRREILIERMMHCDHTKNGSDSGSVPDWVLKSAAEAVASEVDATIEQWSRDRQLMKENISQTQTVGSDGRRNFPAIKLKRKDPPEDSYEELLLLEKQGTNIDDGSKEHDDQRVQVIICSRTHTQLSQLITEIRRIPLADEFNVITLGSRSQLCVHPEVSRTRGSAYVNDTCRKLVDENQCEFKSMNSPLPGLFSVSPMNIEDMFTAGQQPLTAGCPYYASRKALKHADVVFVPYASVLNEVSRNTLGINLNGNILIVDEAHNIMDAVNSSRSVSLTSTECEALMEALQLYLNRYASRLSPRNLVCIKQFQFTVKRLLGFLMVDKGSVHSVPNFLSLAKLSDIDMSQLCRFLHETQFARKFRGFLENVESKGNSNAIYCVQSLLEALQSSSEADRIICVQDGLGGKITFAVIDAERVLGEIASHCKAVLLVGGTMEPLDEFKASAVCAGVSFRSFSGYHIVSPHRIFSRILTSTGTGDRLIYNSSSREDPSLVNALQAILRETLTVVRQGGIVIFVPSYDYASFLQDKLAAVTREGNFQFFMDKGSSKSEEIFSRFRKVVESDAAAVLVSVINGNLSEGINFKDELCRCVILVGMPYPKKGDLRLLERMNYFDNRKKQVAAFPTGSAFYEGCCFKAINQSIGRAIRHSGDWASIIFLDARYERPRIIGGLSKWLRDETRILHSISSYSAELKDFNDRMRSETIRN